MEILNTKLFDRADMEENSVMIAATKAEANKGQFTYDILKISGFFNPLDSKFINSH